MKLETIDKISRNNLAIFDTETDRFVTGIWPQPMLEKILRMWKSNHPDLNLQRYEFRPRGNTVRIEDSWAILIVDKATNAIVCYYHWRNKGYARAYEPKNYKFVKYVMPEGLDITDTLERNSLAQWDGKGEVLGGW